MTARAPRGYLLFVLHAHLPYIRNPRDERFLEEAWLREALTETYLPLLMKLDALERDGIGFRLTMSLTPPLVSMLDDDLLRDRYTRSLESLRDLAASEVDRQRHDPAFRETARFYAERIAAIHDHYVRVLERDVVEAFRRLQDKGLVELIASPATHAYLPLLRVDPHAVRAQVRIGVEHYRERFRREPQGMWLPECGFYPGLDEVLAEEGLRYFFLEAHGVLGGSAKAIRGVYAPIVCPSGVAAFGRDTESSRQVWSPDTGFPGDPDYREFHRDIGFELPLEHIGPHIGPDGIRVQTGIKYHRVTGKTEHKQPYSREAAERKAREHASRFVEDRLREVGALHMDRPPAIVAPFDAELFGHWWFEGPDWIDALFRRVASGGEELLPLTASEYLAAHPESQSLVPRESSWGRAGYHEVWLDSSNDWIQPRLHAAARRLGRLAFRHRGAEGRLRRILDQASRELLLAQSSDWAFILKTGTASRYATLRLEEHLENFDALVALAETGAPPDETWLREIEARNAIFPRIRFELFEEMRSRSEYASVENPEHIVFLTAEAVPYVKVGGLADVAGALPAALAEQGSRVTILLPAYRSISREKHGVRPYREGLSTWLGSRRVPFNLLRAADPAPGVRVLLVEEEAYFGREGVYVDPKTGAEYPDTAERFVFFTRAALEALRDLGEPVDILHSHDHQTALAPAYLKLHFRSDPVLGLAASVYTLHNLGYQGIHPPEILDAAGFGRDLFHPGSPFEYHRKVNFMKLGIHFADKVNTVSETYAREILEDEVIGAGLGGCLRDRGDDFQGILNGIDIEEWNPGGDPHIPKPFGPEDLSDKAKSKRELLKRAGLGESRAEAPLVGVISRLVDQKGFDLVEKALDDLLALGIDMVVLGTGLPKYEALFQEAARRYPGRVAALLKFDNSMAHLIEAGSDIFLMPSLYEPCGLNQMYSLRYGTVPVVRATGGLADTVIDDDGSPGAGVGFSFRPYEPSALLDAVRRALDAFRDRERWRGIVTRGMKSDFSWTASAARYMDLYRSALQRRT